MAHSSDIDIPRTITGPYFSTDQHGTLRKILEWFTDNIVGDYLQFGELEDVTIAAVEDNDIPRYDSATETWINTDDLTLLEGRMTTAEGDITTIQGDITTIQGDITTIEGNITSLEDDNGLQLHSRNSGGVIVLLSGEQTITKSTPEESGSVFNGVSTPGITALLPAAGEVAVDQLYVISCVSGGFILRHDSSAESGGEYGFDLPGDTDLPLNDGDVVLLRRQVDSGMWRVVSMNPAAGTYTPVITGSTNVASSGSPVGMYSRNGNIITGTVSVEITPTAGSTRTTFRFSLPIATDLTTTTQVIGSGSASLTTGLGDILGAYVVGNTTSDQASVQFVSINTGSHVVTVNFQYEVG